MSTVIDNNALKETKQERKEDRIVDFEYENQHLSGEPKNILASVKLAMTTM